MPRLPDYAFQENDGPGVREQHCHVAGIRRRAAHRDPPRFARPEKVLEAPGFARDFENVATAVRFGLLRGR
jgi:hypothetical protein